MNDKRNIDFNSAIYEKIDALSLAASERAEAIQSLRSGEAIANAILGVYSGLRNLFEGSILRHGLKH